MAKTSPSKKLLSMLFGTSDSEEGDIELPNESGKRDKRLPKKSPLAGIMEGYKTLKGLGKSK
jgi:hypothetical protein